MSRRAASVIALAGFCTFLNVSTGLVVAQAPRKAINTASDLPAFSYSVTGTNADVFRSEDAFRPVAEKLRADIDSLLRDYTIEDRPTLRGLHGTLLTLDCLENRKEEVRKEISTIRDLEDKPAAKLMAGLIEEALLDSGGAKADPQEFLRRYSSALNRLPWNIVGDVVKQWKMRLESLSESLPVAVETQSPTVRQTRLVDLATAQRLAERRFVWVFARPVKAEAVEALATYIAAHNEPKPDIWAARSVTLDAGTKAKPVVVGIWDFGVDRSVFHAQLATDGPVPGFDDEGNPTSGELLAFDANQKQRWPETRRLLKGFLDDQNLLDTADAVAYRKYLSTLKPEERRANRESMAFAGSYIHGTHVAGIALEGNPFCRLVVVRVASSNRVPPSPPTLAAARKFAAGTAALTAYLRKQGARVVNMSFTETLGRIEQKLQAAGAGADAAGRRKLAQEIFGVARDGMRKALASTPEILYVAAAGNRNSNSTFDEDVWASIRDLPNLLVVGAVDQAGNEASFTSFGPAVAVYAKGLDVESYVPGGERMKGSGTSAAAPNVTNLAAKLTALDSSLTPADVVKLIKDGSDLSADGRFRLINPKRSVELLQARSAHTGLESSAQGHANDGGPYFGKWKLNVAESNFGETTLAFDRAASGEMQMTYLGRSYRFQVDGNDHPAILGMTAAWKQIDPNTWEAVYKRGGSVWTTDTTRLSSDGKALTINSKGITPAGEPNEHTTIYERVSGGSGLIGTWKTKSTPPAAYTMLELVPSGNDGLIITRPDGRCDAKFDGNDHPVHGPSVPAGITWAIRRTGRRSFDWTTKVNGDVFGETSFTVSDDGKRLKGMGGRAADIQKTTVVFDRVDTR